MRFKDRNVCDKDKTLFEYQTYVLKNVFRSSIRLSITNASQFEEAVTLLHLRRTSQWDTNREKNLKSLATISSSHSEPDLTGNCPIFSTNLDGNKLDVFVKMTKLCPTTFELIWHQTKELWNKNY